jgi:GDSL-like lipase/acylhydrolase family protein
VVIGDSFTYGNGIEERDRFSNLIAGSLGPRYEVLNFGRPGNNLPQHLTELGLALKRSPDFVLLQLYENDFETPAMTARRPRDYPLLPADLDRRIERPSLLYRLLINRWDQFQEAIGLSEGYTNYMARHLRDPDSPDAVETSGMLLQFNDRTRAAGVASGGVFFPALYGLGPKGAKYPFDYLNDRVRNIYRLEQTPYLDLLPAFLTVRDPASLWVNRFDPHPNAKANHLAAIAILNKFESDWRR